MRRLCWIPVALLIAVAGCGDGDAGAADKPTVVATTTRVGDTARSGAGSRFKVVQILAPNADPHEYELRPHDVAAVADADVVLRSGGDVDAWLNDAIDASGTHARVITLSDEVKPRGDDPHWWQDPRNAEIAAREIGTALHVDPSAYIAKLKRLDGAVARCMEKVPRDERKLVTTHDALAYYAARYGIDVIGAVIPSLSTAGQPSAGDTARLIETIRATGVKAVFAESSVNPKVEAAIASATGATVGKALWADTLGPAGSDGATYIQSIESNTRAMVDGFTGGAVSCRF